MKKQILLIGAGGHARSCIDVIERENKYKIYGLVGLKKEIGKRRNMVLDTIKKKYERKETRK